MERKYENIELRLQLKEELQRVIKENNLSIMRIVEVTGISYSTVHRILEGTALPSLSKLEKLADSLNMNVMVKFTKRSGPVQPIIGEE